MFATAKIMFGMDLDGANWSGETSVNQYVCGPLGMLKFLETRYGLGGNEASEFERVDAYSRKIGAANCDWCRESFAIDPWGTASTLLAWRDELVMLGWDFKRAEHAVRIDALAQIEAAEPKLPLGIADRIVRLAKGAKHRIQSELLLTDDYEDLPWIWRKVVKACFDNWKPYQIPQRATLPKVTVIKGVNEIALSRDVARYLSAEGAQSVAVVSEGDTQVLDAELKRLGLPAFGVSDASRERKALQVLVGALSEYGRTRMEEFVVAEVLGVLEHVSRELKKDIDRNPISKLATSHVAALRAKLEGIVTIRRSALWRMVQTIVGEGARCPYSTHELGRAQFLRSPGELMERVDVVLWTPFVPSRGRAGLIFREEEKKLFGALESGEFVVDNERMRRNARETKSWERFLERIRGELVLFVPDRISGEATGVHPFYDVLLKKIGMDAKEIEIRNNDCVNGNVWSLAGRTVTLKTVSAAHPKFSDAYHTDPNPDLVPKKLSPTQLESLLSCPFKWYHKHHLGLTPCAAARSETTKTRQGNLAHKMVEELAKAGVKRENEIDAHFDGLFEMSCNVEIPEFAEPDRKLERENFKKQLLSSVKTLWRLIEKKELKIVASEFEFPEKDFCGVPFSGKADMILEDANGRRHIFDFKWSTRKDYAEKIKDGTSVQLAAYDWLGGFGAESGYYLFPNEKFVENTQVNAEVWARVQEAYQKRLDKMRQGVIDKAIDIGLDDDKSVAKKTLRQQAVQEAGLSIDVHAGCHYCDFKALCGKLWVEGGAE